MTRVHFDWKNQTLMPNTDALLPHALFDYEEPRADGAHVPPAQDLRCYSPATRSRKLLGMKSLLVMCGHNGSGRRFLKSTSIAENYCRCRGESVLYLGRSYHALKVGSEHMMSSILQMRFSTSRHSGEPGCSCKRSRTSFASVLWWSS
jgi:hypothetical protein